MFQIKQKFNLWLEKEKEKQRLVNDLIYTIKSLVFTEKYFDEVNNKVQNSLPKKVEKRIEKLSKASIEQMETFIELLESSLKEEQDRKSTAENKAQAMISTTTVAVSFCAIFISNAPLLLEHGFWGVVGKIISISLFLLAIIFMILAGLFARNTAATDFTYNEVSPTSAIIILDKSIFLEKRILGLVKSLESYRAYNNYKITSLKYSHACYKLTFVTFFSFLLFSLIAYSVNGLPKSDKQKMELLQQKVEKLEEQLKAQTKSLSEFTIKTQAQLLNDRNKSMPSPNSSASQTPIKNKASIKSKNGNYMR